ncbi:hypothetical protein DITRI_Ditri05aG0100000 [Diplodiscus trichospermus]
MFLDNKRVVKFNVDGAFIGKPSPSGIGGVMRDHKGSRKLYIESDSKNTVQWVCNPNLVPWRIRNIINHIENLKLQVKEWRIGHVFRERNQEAEKLAKEGINRESGLLVISTE